MILKKEISVTGAKNATSSADRSEYRCENSGNYLLPTKGLSIQNWKLLGCTGTKLKIFCAI